MKQNISSPRLYSEFASWWPILSAPEDYATEAEYFRKTINSTCTFPPKTLLELGCGGGNNASHLKKHFAMTLVDLSGDMLDISRTLNPECEHLKGDMRTTRLGRTFDAIFIHDAIVYMTTETDLRQAINTAFVHCRPGGVAVFAPDHIRETFAPSTKHGGHDGAERKMRYLEWVWDPDPDDSTYITDMAYLMREKSGKVRCEYDRHVCGLFSREDWLRIISEVGFQAGVAPFDFSGIEPGACDVFLGVKREND